MNHLPRVARFVTHGGVRVYRLSVETFPGHFNNVYLILDGPHSTLFDVGSGLPDSNDGLTAAMHELREQFGESLRIEQVQHVVISHAHIDHFGYVGYFAQETDARVYVHELDARVLQSFEDRVARTATDLSRFMAQSGLPAEECGELEELYRFSKLFFKSVQCDQTVRDGDRIAGGYTVRHVPGHCPGQICLQVDDILLAADHVLSRITPHQSPQSITQFCGLARYFASLQRIRELPGIALTLPGHEREIVDLIPRIDAIAAHHTRRLGQVLDVCRAPVTLGEITQHLFGDRHGYTRLLALEEAGAHVEYLVDSGELQIADSERRTADSAAVLRYRTRGA